MNGYDVDDAVDFFDDADETPNLYRAARILQELMWWTNRNSDGWMYWRKPGQAAKKLVDLLTSKEQDYRDDGCVSRAGESGVVRFTDATEAELKAALTPIKSFLTKQQKEPSHRDRSQPRLSEAERDNILLAGSERPVKALHLTARISFDYEVADGLVTNAEQARQDFVDCLASVSPNDFTITVTEEV